MMKKLFCALLTAVLLLCCASALAEECKYGSADSPCEPGWWVKTQTQEHARACFYHVEDKEDMNSHVLITDWEECTLDEGGECTVCGWDYVREPEADDYDMYWLEMYYVYTEMYGEPPVKASESNGKLTITFNSDWFTFLDEMGVPYTESAMVATELSLAEVDGVWTVASNEYGPGPWMQRVGMMEIGDVITEGGKATAEIKLDGTAYTLTAGGSSEPETPALPEGALGSCTLQANSTILCVECLNVIVPEKTKAYYDKSSHWWACSNCGAVMRENHIGCCDAQDECYVCGVTGMENKGTRHEPEYGCYGYDANSHWEDPCVHCGMPAGLLVSYPHYALCINPTVCNGCMAENVNIADIDHTSWDVWQYDDAYHWYVCEDCGETVKGLHDGLCTADACATCGAPGVTIGDAEHNDNDYVTKRVSDEKCTTYCLDCGYVTGKTRQHFADCDAPEVCAMCGAEDVTLVAVIHAGDDDPVLKSGASGHWWECSLCAGGTVQLEEHLVLCSAPGTCVTCGETGLEGGTVTHTSLDENAWEHDADYCWNICKDCGEVFNKGRHEMEFCKKPSMCDRCGEYDVNCITNLHSFNGISSGYFEWIDGYFYFDDECHWVYCAVCGEAPRKAHEYDSNNKCYWCGYEKKPAAPALPEGALGSCTLQADFPLWCDECDATVLAKEAEAYYSKTHHWWVCASCGENNYDIHSANCDTADTCLVCQSSGVQAEELQHQPNFDNPVYDHDEYAHWDVCELCGAAITASVYQPHYALCTAPDTCVDCGAKDVYFDVVAHVSERKYQHDETHHWYACDGCGETEKQLHSGFCFQPDECDTCLAQGVTVGEFLHDLSGHTSISATECAQSCIHCDYVSGWITGHRASYCNAPDTCIFCGESGIVSEYVDHVEDDLQWRHDENGHWQACSACAGAHTVEAHRIACTEPGVCIDCDATGVDGEICHADLDDVGIFQYDQDYHWFACDVCGEPMDKERHRMEFCSTTTKCDFCQYAGVNVIFGQHSYHGPSQGEYEETEGFYFFDENGHWLHCSRCGDETPQPHAFDSENVCRFCGYEKPALPAECCKYYSPDSPCDVIWWVDKDNQQHARACKNHVEDKEDMYSYVLVTEWADCTPGEDGVCTVCGYDYTPTQDPSDDLSQEECDAYMLEIYYRLLEKKGVPPMDVTLDGDTLTVKINEQFQMMMLELGIPVTETLLAGTTYTLKQVEGAWTVEATEYGPGPWLARTGLIAIGDAQVSGSKVTAEVTLDGAEPYTLVHEEGGVSGEYCKYGSADSPCEPGWWLDRENKRHARACFYHVEDKEDMNSHVLITPWEDCTLDEGGKCTVCGQDYDTSDEEPSYEEYEMYMLEFYFMLTEEMGTAPVDVTVSGNEMHISMKADFFTFLEANGIPVSESMMVETVYTLTKSGDGWTVERSEYGPGAWLEKFGLLEIGSVSDEDGAAAVEITVEGGGTYALTAGGISPVILPGDASSDGEVDIFDALAILQYAVGWGNELDTSAGDVNDDGATDIFDALLILQYAVGWDVELK